MPSVSRTALTGPRCYRSFGVEFGNSPKAKVRRGQSIIRGVCEVWLQVSTGLMRGCVVMGYIPIISVSCVEELQAPCGTDSTPVLLTSLFVAIV